MRGSLWGALALTVAAYMLPTSLANAQNLVLNGDFEIDSDLDGRPNDWFFGPVADTSYVDDDSDGVGTKSIQIDASGADWRSEAFPILPGGTYIWSLDYKFLPGATGDFRADLRFFDGGAFKGEDAPLVSVSNIDQWQTLGPRTVIVPDFIPDNPLAANVGDIRLSSGLFAPGNGLVRFDNVSVTFVPEPSTWVLAALAGCLVAGIHRRRVEI